MKTKSRPKALVKTGQFMLCLLSATLSLVFPLIGILLCKAVDLIYRIAVFGNPFFFKEKPQGIVSDNMLMFVSEIMLVLGTATVYYVIMKEKDFVRPKKCMSKISIWAIIILMIGAQNILGVAIELLNNVFPSVVEDYNDIMELYDATSILMIIAAVILAPIGEEILFRGIIFKLGRKFSESFWVANIIQSVLFGIAHGNIVQGAYAFAMGMVLGVIYRKYNSLVVTIIAHLIFNLLGTFFNFSVLGFLDAPILTGFISVAAGLVLVWVSHLMLERDSATDMGRDAFDKKMYEEIHPSLQECNEEEPVYSRVPEMVYSTEKFKMTVDKQK